MKFLVFIPSFIITSLYKFPLISKHFINQEKVNIVKKMTSLTIYDGANTIGGNKIFVEEKGKGVFLDFGMNCIAYNN